MIALATGVAALACAAPRDDDDAMCVALSADEIRRATDILSHQTKVRWCLIPHVCVCVFGW